MYLSALGCLGPPAQETTASPDAALQEAAKADVRIEFWATMRLDFIMVMLSPKQLE